MCKTIEELKALHDKHCGIDCGAGHTYCVEESSQELREQYAAKYGCICGIACKRCIDYAKCFDVCPGV